MSLDLTPQRPLGTMVAFGFAGLDLSDDLAIARRLGAELLEVLPDFARLGEPRELGRIVTDAGFRVHSAHGCWGGQSIRAARVDLGSTDPATHRASIDDLLRCIDWIASAGGRVLVVHPGGLSAPEELRPRRDALARGLIALADHARGTPVVVCVENMPRGVHPGSRMSDLAALVAELDRPELGLALDTGHAHLTASAAAETRDAGTMLRTTHVHDNLGRHDSHLPPGLGSVDWSDWKRSLDEVRYEGPIILECIRHLRNHPETLCPALMTQLDALRRIDRAGS